MMIEKIVQAIKTNRFRVTSHARKEADEEMIMLPFPKCPVCSNQIVQKEVEEIVRGGNNTAVIKIQAEVCLRCGERLYTPETITLLEKVTRKLELQETAEFQLLGQTYLVPAA